MYDMKRWHQDSILVLDNDPEVEDSIQFNIQPRFSLDLSHFHSTFLIFTRPLSFSLNLSHFHLTFLIFIRPFSFSLDPHSERFSNQCFQVLGSVGGELKSLDLTSSTFIGWVPPSLEQVYRQQCQQNPKGNW